MGRRTWVLKPAVLVFVLLGSGGYILLRQTGAAQPVTLQVAMTPERIARGKYIYTLADCDGCHSARDWTRYAGPVVESARGQGVEFPRAAGTGRSLASANITTDPQTGIGAWPDGLKIRAIRDGVGARGQRLHPLMPSHRFRSMSDGDVVSLVAYLDTLPPVNHTVPRQEPGFAERWFRWNGMAQGVPEPDRANLPEYGKYLATLAGCGDCHTAGRRSPFARALYGGGRPFHLPGGTVISANITPDPHTGIGRWSPEDWLQRVYQHREYVERGSPKVGPENLTVMPWLGLCQLQADDLNAIFAYLRTQKPVYRPIVLHPLN